MQRMTTQQMHIFKLSKAWRMSNILRHLISVIFFFCQQFLVRSNANRADVDHNCSQV